MFDKHAFLFLVREINEQALSVMEALDDDLNDFYIHVDAKTATLNEQLVQERIKRAGVFFVPRVSVGWAAYSMVEAELNLLTAATASKTAYRYYHLLSESDFPLVTSQQLHKRLQDSDREFVEFERVDDQNTINRLRYYYPLQERLGKKHGVAWVGQKLLLVVEHIMRVNRLRHVKSISQIGKGSQWFSITDDFAKYIISRKDLIKQLCKDTRAPDEVFIQTLALNSEFKDRIAYMDQGNLRYIRWETGNSPQFLSHDDLDVMLRSDKLFARKFGDSSEMRNLKQDLLKSISEDSGQ
ncbi:beta-1,6-N-acetylglucosaminyltransferase [Lacticaseibacillus sp. GG6-2]